LALRFPVPQRYGDCRCVSSLPLRRGAGFLGSYVTACRRGARDRPILDGKFTRGVALVLDMLAATGH